LTTPPTASSSTTATSPIQPAASSSGFNLTPEQLARLRSIVTSAGSGSAALAAAQQPELSLTDILTPANLNPLFTSHPELISTLFPHLPPDLPTPPSPETLQQIIASPQFKGAVRSLDQAFRTGLLGGLVRGLGLPEEAGTGIEAFLRAVQEQAEGESGEEGEGMDTD